MRTITPVQRSQTTKFHLSPPQQPSKKDSSTTLVGPILPAINQKRGITGSFTFAVTKGNYPGQIRDALKERGNWSEVKEDVGITQADFFWKALNFTFSQYDQMD